MCSTFASVKRGLACQNAFPTTDPVDRPLVGVDWDSGIGDLTDLRNRLGLLCPMSTRFIDVDLTPMPAFQNKQRYDVKFLMQKMYNKQSVEDRPYFQDPYGRDTPRRRVQLMVNGRDTTLPVKRRHIGQGFSGASRQIKQARLQLLHSVMEDTAKRREEERKRDAVIWGQAGAAEAAQTAKPASRKRSVSPHLYQPKKIQDKSEFTKKMEVAMVASRKKDKEDAIIRRLQEHKNHGFLIRIHKLESDARHREHLKAKISEKENKSSCMNLDK